MKYKRQGEIIRIVREKQIKTHEQLIDELEKAGYDVTQATVSRDIKELGLIKAPSNSSAGAYYIMPSGISENTDKHINIFSDAVKDIIPAMHTVVIKTYPGMAPAVAAAVDSVMCKEKVGSVAGDDNVLIISASAENAENTAQKLRKIFKS